MNIFKKLTVKKAVKAEVKALQDQQSAAIAELKKLQEMQLNLL